MPWGLFGLDFQGQKGPRAPNCLKLGLCFCEIAEISRPKRPQGTKLSQAWPKHAVQVAPCPLGCMPGAICPQYLTGFPKTCPSDQKTVLAARVPLTNPLASRLALHACPLHLPLQQGAMPTTEPSRKLQQGTNIARNTVNNKLTEH